MGKKSIRNKIIAVLIAASLVIGVIGAEVLGFIYSDRDYVPVSAEWVSINPMCPLLSTRA